MSNNISSYLNDIMTKVYGKDVRSAIHNAIETCYTDVSTSATLANTAAANADAKATLANTAATNANNAASWVPGIISAAYDPNKTYKYGNIVTYNSQIRYIMTDVAANDGLSDSNSCVITADEDIFNTPNRLNFSYVRNITKNVRNAYIGTYKQTGSRFVLNGYTTDKDSGVLYDITDKYTEYGSTANTSRYGSDTNQQHKAIKLINGHIYRLRSTYISGTSLTGTGINRPAYLWVCKEVPYTDKESTTYGLRRGYSSNPYDGRSAECTFLYTDEEFPYGIFIALYISRSGGPVYEDYTFDGILEDVTSDRFVSGIDSIAPYENGIASSEHTVGELMMFGSRLVKVIRAIAPGERITLTGGSANVQYTTIADELNEIRNLLS